VPGVAGAYLKLGWHA